MTTHATPPCPKPFASDDPVADYGVDVPEWIEQDITWDDVDAIVQGGCSSGAYMPAATYHQANATMAEHGDEVIDYLNDNGGESPCLDLSEDSWCGFACKVLSQAVELWALGMQEEQRTAERDRADAIEEWEDTNGYEAPADWASYLINGDHSGLDDADKAEADAFIDMVVKDNGHANFCDVHERGLTMTGDYRGRDVAMYILAP